MSWLQWQGETWPTDAVDAELRLHLGPANAGCPRQSWHLGFRHYVFDQIEASDRKMERWLDADINELNLQESDWRRFAGLEIRADAPWHEAHEHTNEFGRLGFSAPVDVSCTRLRCVNAPGEEAAPAARSAWLGHDFLLRFGARDELHFPCELDAWLLPHDEYYRQEPESAAEVARFAEGPPTLRIIARALFEGGSVCVPRAGRGDPIAWARRALRETIGWDGPLHEVKVEWAVRRNLNGKATVPMPGWSSTVVFRTRPYEAHSPTPPAASAQVPGSGTTIASADTNGSPPA
ncbi:MAG: hypothetical protein JO295_14710 [Verrucomicrobia bacterium]|nr:hypothetical protein [Verrucomicrobiota bacterium]